MFVGEFIIGEAFIFGKVLLNGGFGLVYPGFELAGQGVEQIHLLHLSIKYNTDYSGLAVRHSII